MPSIVVALALVFAGAGLVLLIFGVDAARDRRALKSTLTLLVCVVFFCLALVCGAVAVGTKGYRALTREDVAAVVTTKPTGIKSFDAHFYFPDGRESLYSLAGDELYVDAHILKWKPIANLLGLHTTYELDRVAGRYRKLEEEQSNARTVFELSNKKPFDLFDVRVKHPLLKPLVDAEYGSATFIPVDMPAEFEVRVSTTGLLVRPVE